jgi:hypothetical protein
MPKARPSQEDRIKSLEGRVTAIEATLNGRMARLETKLEHIADGVRASIECNGYIVKEIQEARAYRGQEPNEGLKRASESGKVWTSKK